MTLSVTFNFISKSMCTIGKWSETSVYIIHWKVFSILTKCNGGYFSETSLHPRIPPARLRDPVIQIKPQAPKARGLIRIQVLVSSQKQGTVPQPRATA